MDKEILGGLVALVCVLSLTFGIVFAVMAPALQASRKKNKPDEKEK